MSMTFRVHAGRKTNHGQQENAHKWNHLCADVKSMAGADRLGNDFRETDRRAGQVIKSMRGKSQFKSRQDLVNGAKAGLALRLFSNQTGAHNTSAIRLTSPG